MKTLLKLLVVLGLGLGVVFGGSFLLLERWSRVARTLSEPSVIELNAGEGLNELSRDLAGSRVIQGPFLFKAWVKFFKDYRQFQAGTYRFEGEVSPVDVLKAFTDGDVYHPLILEVTIPEGFTLEQIIARAEAQGVGTAEDLRRLAHNLIFVRSLGVEHALSLEGFLYPSTYRFYDKLPTPEGFLGELVKEFFQNLPNEYETKVKALGLDMTQAVTFASLIEKETRVESEKPHVSEVIWNRLKKGIPLGIDATVIYGIQDYDGNLKREHLRDPTNPYNSRIHKGLPPTPIGSPAQSSLLAVLNPSNQGYFYYVLLPGEGVSSHHFSKTLEEHNRFVKKLVESQKSSQ